MAKEHEKKKIRQVIAVALSLLDGRDDMLSHYQLPARRDIHAPTLLRLRGQ